MSTEKMSWIFIAAPKWKQPRYPATRKGVINGGKNIQQDTILPLKEWSIGTAYSIGEPWKHAIWKKSDTKDNIYDCIYIKWIGKSIKTEGRILVA